MEPMTPDDYAAAHAKFMPTGLAWPRAAGSVLMRLFRGLASGYTLIDRCLAMLVRELDPRSTSALLPDWETFAGLPDECSLDTATESERRDALTSKITASGGASAEYFEGIATALGYPGSTVSEFTVARFGRARFGDRFYGVRWGTYWQLNLPGQGITKARFVDRFGTRFRLARNTVLECRITKLKPSHTKVLFHYGDS